MFWVFWGRLGGKAYVLKGPFGDHTSTDRVVDHKNAVLAFLCSLTLLLAGVVVSAFNNLLHAKESEREFCTGGLDPGDPFLRSERNQGFSADPFYGRARCWPM